MGGNVSNYKKVKKGNKKPPIYKSEIGNKTEWYYYKGIFNVGLIRHRNDDKPSVIYRNTSGIVTQKTYYKHGKIHRDSGPARIKFDEQGICKSEEWFTNNILHREDGPASIDYGDNLMKERWYHNGDITKERRYWKNTMTNEKLYTDGKCYLEKEYNIVTGVLEETNIYKNGILQKPIDITI